jgi:formate-dependent phosphoribosylglycinamide formyltransferase (GAR transformylase)
MPHVIFVAPHFPAGQRRFVRGLKKVGIYVTGIGDLPGEHLDGELRHLLDGYEYVPHLGDEDALLAAVRRIQERGPWVDRLEATIESHMLPVARVREKSAIPGLSVEQVTLCRDKFLMKQFLRQHGIPCAANAAVSTASEARAFADEVGYSLILKPRDGAGAAATYRLDDAQALEAALAEVGLGDEPGGFFTLESFVSGHEGFYDTLTARGEVQHEFVTHYYPNVLEAMRTRWISPQMVHTNRLGADGYDELRHFGRKVIDTFGLGTTATHMEWFAGPHGLWFSEIGARPPGCNHWDLYCEANGIDLYADWARAVAGLPCEEKAERQLSAGLINLRPTEDGRIVGYEGVQRMQTRYGAGIFKLRLPPVGSATQPIEAGYLANAYVCVKHPDYDVLRAILDDIGETVKVIARP